MKECKKCKVIKPLDDFNKDARNRDGRTGKCRNCINAVRVTVKTEESLIKQRLANKKHYKKNKAIIMEKQRQYRKNNPELKRRWTLSSRYGITLEEYDKMLTEQDNKCAICGGVNSNGWALYVDHDHSCCLGNKSCGKCVRALLCGKCNTGLGHFKENEQVLQKAIEYIRKFKETE